MSRRVTILDIAKELNTTAATVSRALNDHPRISYEMKVRVQNCAEKLNFKNISMKKYEELLKKTKMSNLEAGEIIIMFLKQFKTLYILILKK